MCFIEPNCKRWQLASVSGKRESFASAQFLSSKLSAMAINARTLHLLQQTQQVRRHRASIEQQVPDPLVAAPGERAGIWCRGRHFVLPGAVGRSARPKHRPATSTGSAAANQAHVGFVVAVALFVNMDYLSDRLGETLSLAFKAAAQ